MKLHSFEFQGKRVEGQAQVVKDKIWVYINGKTLCFEKASSNGRSLSRGRRKIEGRSDTDQVHAPMPGKITKILVNENQKVELGDPLVVMEAMKMEYTLKSELKGSIKKIFVSVGQQVALNEVLIKLE